MNASQVELRKVPAKRYQSKLVRMMRAVVDFLGKNRWFQKPFFWLGFFTIRLLFPVQFLILKELMNCKSVLDLGCGRHSMVPIIPSGIYTVGVEFFSDAHQEALRSGRHSKVIQSDVTKIEFENKSFDAVVMLDVLEHLTKEEGEALIRKMERWAKEKIIIFTPNGFIHQDCYDQNPLMEHKSGWKSEELAGKGFRVRGVRGFKSLYPSSLHPDEEKSTFWTRICDLTQAVTYFIPSLAFQLFCVKNLKTQGK